MDEKVLQFRVGVVVIAAVIITVFLVFVFGEGKRIIQGQYTIYMRFSQAPGVTVDTPVRKSGVLIGRVTKVDLDDKDNSVLLTARIDSNRKILRQEVCRIAPASFLGDAIIEFVLPGANEMFASLDENKDGRLDEREKAKANESIQDGEYTAEGIVASNPLMALGNMEDDIRQAIRNIESAFQRVDMLAFNMNKSIGDGEQLQRVVQKSEIALDTITLAMTNVNDFVADPELKTSLKRTLNEFPKLSDEFRATLADIRGASAGVQRMSQRAEQNLANLENFTKPLGERGEELIDSVENSLGNLDELLEQLVSFGASVNESQGTLGMLLRDRQLYDRLDRAAANVEDITRRIRPVIDNVRVASDKVARDPSVIIKGPFARDRIGTGIKNGAPTINRD